jgi:hypothetical protein
VADRARGRDHVQKKTLIAREQDRPAIARRRAQWRKYQGRIDPRRLVFIDETWAKPVLSGRPAGQPKGPT